jgi:hypothetical protein
MKHIIKKSIIAAFLVAAPLLMFAQPPHPNGGGAPNASNTKVGDQPTAPIGNGTFILLAFAAAYAGRKVYELRTVKEE